MRHLKSGRLIDLLAPVVTRIPGGLTLDHVAEHRDAEGV